MAARRSSRLAGKKLGNDFNEIIATSTIEAHRETCAFRLLDLPPELREFIYAYATSIACTRYLGKLRVPPLALVSKQIRAEVLPQFFAQQPYEGVLTSNYPLMKSIDQERQSLDGLALSVRAILLRNDEFRRQNYGRIHNTNSAMEIVNGLREREQYIPLFRNVQLKVFAGTMRLPGNHLTMECLTLVLSVPTKRVLRPQIDLNEPDGGSLFPEQIARTLERVRRKADEIAKGRERFLEFTFDDLETLAKQFCFCFEPI
ncbi:hypothetical protein LTR10_004217 [Elasticomyces elasticus]|nr:hypothetical protein LTR10_004217 [Elasticomyces elasticus]KAK4977601.1 hypothetical protein LTR42_001972 [Elasticomyces elasticus]